jgi:DNA-binding response OmpR family regulator
MTKKKILVAEDDRAIIEVVKIILESEGYDVFTADQAETVHKTIASQKPDMILLDIWLYGEDGGQIAKKIKAQAHTKHLPIVLMSANNETEKITKEVGADDFLLKPFNIDDLLYIVRKYVKS